MGAGLRRVLKGLWVRQFAAQANWNGPGGSPTPTAFPVFVHGRLGPSGSPPVLNEPSGVTTGSQIPRYVPDPSGR